MQLETGIALLNRQRTAVCAQQIKAALEIGIAPGSCSVSRCWSCLGKGGFSSESTTSLGSVMALADAVTQGLPEI